jgi:hypothetical protein
MQVNEYTVYIFIGLLCWILSCIIKGSVIHCILFSILITGGGGGIYTLSLLMLWPTHFSCWHICQWPVISRIPNELVIISVLKIKIWEMLHVMPHFRIFLPCYGREIVSWKSNSLYLFVVTCIVSVWKLIANNLET